MNKSTAKTFSPLVANVVEGIEEVKGENIAVLDLRNLENSVCDFFVVCEGTSNTQVSAIHNSIEKSVREKSKDKPWHVEGRENSTWILMDYVSTAVHIFQRENREFYDIEGLWGDAEITLIES